MKVELAILNYNGRHHLEHLLPTAIREAESYGPDCRVVVVDNLSPNDDAAWMKVNYPSVELWMAPGNEYLFSYNEYARQSTADILVFLNNDLKLCVNFLPPLLRHFSSIDVFSVSATSRNWEDSEYTFGPIQLHHHHGAWYWQPDFKNQTTGLTFFTSGGFMAVDRKKFLQIGGFDTVFFPAYGEDLDLCFRAWKKGWKCIFEPESIVLHRENGSWSHSGDNRAKYLQARARFLFVWINLPRACGLLERVPYALLRCARIVVSGEFWQIRAWASAKKTWYGLPWENRQEKVSLGFLDKFRKNISN